jgi:HD-like signal output (HDOD) protein
MPAVMVAEEDLVKVAQTFPAGPRILGELGLKLRNPNTELWDIALVIKRDTSLSARIIRAANSVVFSPVEPVSSIEQAAGLMGFHEVHRIVGAVAAEQFQMATVPGYGVSGDRLRQNSLLVALLMEELAGVAGEEPREAYTIGLLRSLGKLALARLAGKQAGFTMFDPAQPGGLAAWEQAMFGMTGAAATATILTAWHFPHEIPKAIAEHTAPKGRNLPFTHLLHLAARLADQLGYGLPGENGFWTDTDEIYAKSGVDPRATKRPIDRAFAAFDRLTRAVA